MRSQSALVASLLLLVSLTTLPAQELAFIRGDVNVDGAVDLSDPVAILEFLFLGGAALVCDDAADTNDSGAIDLSDAAFALAYLFLGGGQPPAPFPGCGADPTPDALGCESFPGCRGVTSVRVSPGRGGTVTSADGGLTLDIPAGAVAEEVTISVRALAADEIPGDVGGGDGPPAVAWELMPDGLEFLQPIGLGLEIDAGEFIERDGEAVTVRLLTVLVRSSDGTIEPPFDASGEVDVDAGRITVSGGLEHFSSVVVRGGPLTMTVNPRAADSYVGGLQMRDIVYRTDDSWKPCEDCEPEEISGFFFEPRYDVISSSPSILEVVGHQELNGRSFRGALVDTVTLACRAGGSTKWGPLVSGVWSGEESDGRVPITGELLPSTVLLGQTQCRPLDLELTKEASVTEVQSGQEVEFRVYAELRDGPPRLTDVRLTDSLPDVLRFRWTRFARLDHDDGTIEGNDVGDVVRGRPRRLLLHYGTVARDVEEAIDAVNFLELTSNELDPVSTSAVVRVNPRPPAAVRIDRHASSNTAAAGESLLVTIDVTNLTSDLLDDLTVVDMIDSPDFVEGVQPSHGGMVDGDAVVWDDISIQPDASRRFLYLLAAAEVADPTVVRLTADVSTDLGDATAEDSILIEPDFPPGPVSITKTDSTDGVAIPGETYCYTLTLRGPEGEGVSGVTIVDQMDPTLVAEVVLSGPAVVDAGSITYRDVDVPSFGAFEVTYCVRLRDDIDPLPAQVINHARAERGGTLGQISHVVRVEAPSGEVTIEKTDSAGGRAAVGETVTYTLTVTNHGDVPLVDYSVWDDMDPTLIREITIDDERGFTQDGKSFWIGLESLAPGDSLSLSYGVELGDKPGVLRNRARVEVDSNELDRALHELEIVDTPTPTLSYDRMTDGLNGTALYDTGSETVVIQTFGEDESLVRYDLDSGELLPLPPSTSFAQYTVAPDDGGALRQAASSDVGVSDGVALLLFPSRPRGEGGGAGVVAERVDVNSAGEPADDRIFTVDLSAAPYRVMLHTPATNLVENDTNGFPDIFVRDVQTGTTTRVSVASDGSEADGVSFSASISANGRVVAFASGATNLVPGDTNRVPDAFRHDLDTGVTTRINVTSAGEQSTGGVFAPRLSADGNVVAFSSNADDLIAGDLNETQDVFVHLVPTGETRRINLAPDGSEANDSSFAPEVSGDGRYVLFSSRASNLVAGDTNETVDAFLHDLASGETRRVSVRDDGTESPFGMFQPQLAGDGRRVVLTTVDALVEDDVNEAPDLYAVPNPFLR